jgi:hypothetical protein
MMTNAQKAQKAYNKSVHKVSMTETDKAYYAEPLSPMSIRGQHVWVEDHLIPAISPAKIVDAVYDQNGLDASVSGDRGIIQYKEVQMTFVSTVGNSFSIPDEYRAIGFREHDGQYAPEFWNTLTNQQIPFGTAGMEFDADGGILWFVDGRPASIFNVTAKYWRYIGRAASELSESQLGLSTITYPIHIGNSDLSIDASGTVVTMPHNLNSDDLHWKLRKGNEQVYPQSFIEIDNNNASITLNPIPLVQDNVTMKLTKIGASDDTSTTPIAGSIDALLEKVAATTVLGNTYNIDWNSYGHHDIILTQATTLTQSNIPPVGFTQTITMKVSGGYALDITTLGTIQDGAVVDGGQDVQIVTQSWNNGSAYTVINS